MARLAIGKQNNQSQTGGRESTGMPKEQRTTMVKRLCFHFCFQFPVSISFPFPAFPYALVY